MQMTLQGAVLSLKAASDIAKGFLHLNSLADVQGKVIELQEAILAAQSSALTAPLLPLRQNALPLQVLNSRLG